MTKTPTCADCGQTIEFVPNLQQWGHRKGGGHEFCCRTTWDPDRPHRMLTADFHHLEGTVQRHFAAKDPA